MRNSHGFKGYGREGNWAGKSRSESKKLWARYLCEPIYAPGFRSQKFPDPFPIRHRSNKVERNSWGWIIGTLGHSQEAWLYCSILPNLPCSICIHEASGQVYPMFTEGEAFKEQEEKQGESVWGCTVRPAGIPVWFDWRFLFLRSSPVWHSIVFIKCTLCVRRWIVTGTLASR